MSNYIENPPSANILINSMRSIGYSFETAISDIIDNSISANANDIEIIFPNSKGEEYICICDNGCGMSYNELFDAMKYGSTNKFFNRNNQDLGRFGLGLKTSSFSQCRKLTVISKKDNIYSGFTWDLDYLLNNNSSKWTIQEYSLEELIKMPHFNFLKAIDSGTIVIWENFDIIKKTSKNSVFIELTKYQKKLERHLSLIFHRFLSKGITIRINNYSLIPLDPFLENHNRTTIKNEITLNIKDNNNIERTVIIQPYILPYQKYMSEEDFIKVGGKEKYTSMQGFYIYRNERLIIYGTWFNRPKSELSKYARIKVDIPNTLDDIWEIDIKKQRAKIPPNIEHKLNNVINDVIGSSKRVQSYRGRRTNSNSNIEYIWQRKEIRGGFEYSLNRNAQLFSILKSSLDSNTWNKMNKIFFEIEKNLPYHQIYLDEAENKVSNIVELTSERENEIEDLAKFLINMALDKGNSKDNIINKLFLSEPFNNYPNLKYKLLKENF